MRALALISLAASCLALPACGPSNDGQDADNAVLYDNETDPCVGAPNSTQCRQAEARQACSESADQNRCVADYLTNYPAAAEQ